jgi:hypothetical protein
MSTARNAARPRHHKAPKAATIKNIERLRTE